MEADQNDIRALRDLLGQDCRIEPYAQTGIHRAYLVHQDGRKLLARVHGNRDVRAAEVERAILAGLDKQAVPVPHVVAHATDPLITVFDFIEGVHAKPAQTGELFDERCRSAMTCLAAIHQSGLVDLPFERTVLTEVDRGLQQRDNITRHFSDGAEFIEDLEALGAFARSHRVPETILHNDYRCNNILFADDKATVAAVIDFEWSCTGPPVKDVAQALLEWHVPDGSDDIPVDRMQKMLAFYNAAAEQTIAWNKELITWMRFAAIADAVNYVITSLDRKPTEGPSPVNSYMYQKSKRLTEIT